MPLGQFFSQRFGYATHALAFMGTKPFGTLTTLPELGQWLRTIWAEASEAYLSNVVQRLARGGVLRSHRGIGGGYSLARTAEAINLRNVAEVLEGVALEQCALSLGPVCPLDGRCSIQCTLRKVEEQYLSSMEKITVADLAVGLAKRVGKNVSA